MSIVFSVDLEDWYQTHDFNINCSMWDNYEDRIEKNTMRLLELFSKHKTSAVFFVLGYVAKKHPALLREIIRNGHEIGSHSMMHKKVFDLKPEEFRKDLLQSKAILEDATGEKTEYYRAPSWSINWKNIWFFEILDEEGFVLDSSIQPFKTPLSGMNGAPLELFNPVVGGKKLGLVEFPSTVFNVGNFKIPFSGGFYLRLLPVNLILYMFRNVSQKRHCMIYTHTWELDEDQPRLRSPFYIRMEHYYGLSATGSKIERLLNEFSFVSLNNIIKGGKPACFDMDKKHSMFL